MSSDRKERPSRTKLECPNCHAEQLARIARRGFLRNHVYPIFGRYPWQCAVCGKEYLIRKRSAGYGRIPSSKPRASEAHSER